MAQTKLYAPEGMHFMVNRDGGFYLMKNPDSGYKSHKSVNGERSALYIAVEVKKYHATGSATRSTGAIYHKASLTNKEKTINRTERTKPISSRTKKSKPTSRGGY